ncbi:LOW QUALITY PROTEIN: hypothetical protein YC2023_034719 [Brassica napus]
MFISALGFTWRPERQDPMSSTGISQDPERHISIAFHARYIDFYKLSFPPRTFKAESVRGLSSERESPKLLVFEYSQVSSLNSLVVIRDKRRPATWKVFIILPMFKCCLPYQFPLAIAAKTSLTKCADEDNVNCLRSIKSQVEDPNGYLSSWVFRNVTEGSICKFSVWNDVENKVINIELSGYGLKGEFPLGFNQCSALGGLNLSGNNFFGVLPSSSIASLVPLVTFLDLSYNQFSGEIPASLWNITYLNCLMLQHNQFTGQLPPELASLRRLATFLAADYQLTCPPLGIGVESFANNKGLCGWPIDYCIEQEEKVIRFGKIGAAVSAPVGTFLGWFFNGRKKKRGDIRHRS